MVWGSVLLLLVLAPIVGYFFMGGNSANARWVIVRFPVAAALIVGIRGAWLSRTTLPRPDYVEVFE